MNLPRWNLVLFAMIGVLAVIVLVGLPGPDGGRSGFDSRTGQRNLTVWDLMRKARRSGDARTALFLLESVEGAGAELPLVKSAIGILEAELALPKLGDLDLEAAASLPLADRWRLLRDASDDAAVARATHAFFAPVFDELEDADVRGPDVRSAQLFARLQGDAGSELEAIVSIARSFAAAGRARAARRWRLRGLAIDAEDARLREGLVRDAIAHGRLAEAWVAQAGELYVEATREVQEEFWHRRARIATWLGLQDARAEALEQTLALTEDARLAKSIRDDLVAVYPAIGQPERAVPHAIRLAHEAGEVAQVEAAAYLALESGRVEEGLRVLIDIARQLNGEEQRALREKIAAFALQDLRTDLAVRVLEEQLEADFDERIAARLEGFYRQFGMHARLAKRLEARMLRGDVEVGAELLSLLTAMGDRVRIARAVTKLAGLPADALRPAGPGEARSAYGDEGDGVAISGLAASLLVDSRVRPESLFAAIRRLRPLFAKPALRSAIEAALRRFPADENAIALRCELVDLEADPRARALAAKALFENSPEKLELLEFWVERASWADDAALAIEARERWLERDANNIANLRALATLCDSAGRREDALAAWRRVAELEGPRSRAHAKVVRTLFSLGRADEALAAVAASVDAGPGGLEAQLEVAELLFSENRSDAALAYYKAVLSIDADHKRALLRCGQILSWSNEARSAIPHFERLVELGPEEPGRVAFYLAEAYASAGRKSDASAAARAAVRVLERRENASFEQRSMLAKALARVGDATAAEPILEELLAEKPDSDDLRLDWAETLVHVGRVRDARRKIAITLARDPEHRRALRMDGSALVRAKRFDEASARFEEYLALEGEDSAVLSDLAFLRESVGDWHAAQDGFRRWLTLRPDSREAMSGESRLFDLLAETARLSLVHTRIGDDRVSRARAHASHLVAGDDLRLAASIGAARWEGRAAIAPGETLRASSALLDLQLEQRFRGQSCIAAGLMAAPGLGGKAPVGAWIAAQLVDAAPYRLVEARAFVGEPWVDAPATASLEGRAHGVEVATWTEFGGDWWGGGELRLRSLSIDPSRAGKAVAAEHDGEFAGSVSVGRRISSGPTAVDPLWRTRHCGSARSSPQLRAGAADAEARDPLLQAYATLATQRLLGDRRLAQLVPVAARSTSLRVTLAGEAQLAEGLGVGGEVSLGHEFETSGLLWGLGVRSTWRPSRGQQLSAFFSSGRALARDGDASSLRVGLQWVVRW